MHATVRVDYLYVYPFGWVEFEPGQRVRVVARAICGPEARTIISLEGRSIMIEQGEDDFLTFDGDPDPLEHSLLEQS